MGPAARWTAATSAFAILSFVAAFSRSPVLPPPRHARSSDVAPLRMAPRFDASTGRWSPSSKEEEDGAGYPPFGSLLRQGPKPFFQRVLKPDLYDQAVLKYMANEGVDRNVAQGNMDAYLANPNDWAYQYFEERRGGANYDYVNGNTDVKSLVLTGFWSSLVLSVVARAIYCLQTGVSFYDFL
uniref:Uncharacterized protein n=1 Tax=Trieres chinensis TaxID=1514140 RepID=A0A7S1Z1N7_TRICV